MNKPKIAFVLPALNMGGAQRVVTTLANALSSKYNIVIITFTKTKRYYDLDKSVTVVHCVDHIEPSSNAFDGLKNNYHLLKRIHSLTIQYEVKLLISFLTSANILTTLVAKYNRIPVIISERNNPFSEKIPRIWQQLRSFTYPKSNYVVVQTETIKSYYTSKIKKDRLRILPNPISADLTEKRSTTIPKENIVLNAGRLADQKAQDILIKAFSKTNNKEWKLVIAGEGPNREKYEQLIEELDLKDKVVLLGRQKDIHLLYNKSKIFAFSSIYEGFPNALIEAMHFGLACVSTDCPTGPSEMIENDKNGFIVPMNDVKEMADKLNILMNNREKRVAFGEKAVQSVKKYEVEAVVKQWDELLENCLK